MSAITIEDIGLVGTFEVDYWRDPGPSFRATRTDPADSPDIDVDAVRLKVFNQWIDVDFYDLPDTFQETILRCIEEQEDG